MSLNFKRQPWILQIAPYVFAVVYFSTLWMSLGNGSIVSLPLLIALVSYYSFLYFSKRTPESQVWGVALFVNAVLLWMLTVGILILVAVSVRF